MNYQSEPITMWFDRRLVLRKSPIHNIGTFVTHDIDAGELLVMVTGGLVVTQEDRRSGSIQLAPDMYNQESLTADVYVLTPKLFQYYINHSCEANAVDITRKPSSTQYVALRDIRANEEITADYYNETTLDVCNCNSPNCRWKKTLPNHTNRINT